MLVRELPARDIHGDVDQHGAGTSGCGDVERLGNHIRQVGRVIEQVVVFGDRDGDARDVRLLERVGAQYVRGHLSREDNERHRVHVRVRDAGDRVGGARTAGDDHHAWLPGDPREAVGGVRGALLVPGEHGPHALGLVERVEDGQHHSAGIPEDGTDALGLERLHECLCGCHPHALTSCVRVVLSIRAPPHDRRSSRIVRSGRGTRG